MKKYAIMQVNGAIVVSSHSKKEALAAFVEKGYKVSMKDVYLY